MAAVAIRVFGTPITQGTRTQRAQEAKNNQNADGKLDQVLLQVSLHSQKAAAGGVNLATSNTTSCLMYNATGEPITYVTAYDWEGHVVIGYPVSIQNGQWASFKHSSNHKLKGSIAAVVYNIQNCCDAMLTWNNPWKIVSGENNTAYCEMHDPGYFSNFTKSDWDKIYKKLKASGSEHKTSFKSYATKVSIDKEGNSPSYKAILYHEYF